MVMRHAVVWLDHVAATVIKFSERRSVVASTASRHPKRKLHRKAGIRGSGHLPADVELFEQIVAAIGATPEVLVTGPGLAKAAFERHVGERHPDLAARIVGTETLDHPTNRQLLAFGRDHFRKVDEMLGDG